MPEVAKYNSLAKEDEDLDRAEKKQTSWAMAAQTLIFLGTIALLVRVALKSRQLTDDKMLPTPLYTCQGFVSALNGTTQHDTDNFRYTSYHKGPVVLGWLGSYAQGVPPMNLSNLPDTVNVVSLAQVQDRNDGRYSICWGKDNGNLKSDGIRRNKKQTACNRKFLQMLYSPFAGDAGDFPHNPDAGRNATHVTPKEWVENAFLTLAWNMEVQTAACSKWTAVCSFNPYSSDCAPHVFILSCHFSAFRPRWHRRKYREHRAIHRLQGLLQEGTRPYLQRLYLAWEAPAPVCGGLCARDWQLSSTDEEDLPAERICSVAGEWLLPLSALDSPPVKPY
jgi:hypothetical protein